MEIAAIIAAFTGLVTACFAGYIAIRQLPQIQREVNGNMAAAQNDLRDARKDLSNIAHDAIEQSSNKAHLESLLASYDPKEKPKA